MGFMDKAKQLAEQAQQKLDEAQKNFNQSGSPQAQPGEGGVKYDEHGRPIQDAPPAASRIAAARGRGARPAGARTARPGTALRPHSPFTAPGPRFGGRPGRHGAPAEGPGEHRRRPGQHVPRPVQAAPAVNPRFGRDMSIGGILTAMVTPFDRDGALDEDAAVRLMHHLLENGSDGLVLAGTTGESPTLTDEEKLRLWELGVAETRRDATIIAGTGTYDTRHSVELTERATDIGVDAMLVVTPYYNRPNPRGIKAHFEAVAAATDRPIVVYNIPSRTATDIPNDLLAELAQTENVAAVKQARYEDMQPIDGMDLLAGNDDVLARVMDMGGTGGILVASHLVGREMRRIIDEPDQRQEIEDGLRDLYRALTVTTNPIPVKTALQLAGHEVGGFRLPLVDASEEERTVIREALERHKLLAAVP